MGHLLWFTLAWGLSLHTILYPSWAALIEVRPGESIQSTIDSATHGDEIVVMPGRYLERINFIGKNLTIRSATPEDPQVVAATIIDASGAGSVVTLANGEDRMAQICGIHLIGGRALYGGGVFIDEASPEIRSCLLSENVTFNIGGIAGAGAGIYCRAGRPQIEGCRFVRNHSQDDGGGVFVDQGDISIFECVFDQNQTHDAGGGVSLDNSSTAEIVDCTFSSNSAHWGGGLHARSYSSIEIDRCVFRGNSAVDKGGGISVFFNTTLFVKNCLLTENYAGNFSEGGVGGAIDAINRCDGALKNCTVYNNQTDETGGGIRIHLNSHWVISNSILWENEPISLLVSVLSTAPILYCNLEEETEEANGNFSKHPLFVDSEHGNFRLSMDSPCIDAGSNELFGSSSSSEWARGDLDQHVRAWDGNRDTTSLIDVGPYEFGSVALAGELNNSGSTDPLDLYIAQTLWRISSGVGSIYGDQNGDNRFDANDLIILRHAWGRDYE